MILIVTASHAGFMLRAEQFVHDHGTAEQRHACERLWSGTFGTPDQMEEYYAAMGPLYSRRYDPVAAAAVHGRATYAAEPLNRAFGPGGVLRSFDLRAEIAGITVPTLVLAGRHDWICPPEFSEETHRLIAGSRLRVFDDSSHSIRADEPEALNAAIREFVIG